MANTYTQIYIHIIFAVESRQNLIVPEHNNELQKYITGIVTEQSRTGRPTDQIAFYRRLGRLAADSIGDLTQGCAPACPGLLYVAPMGLRECGSAEKQFLPSSLFKSAKICVICG